MLILYNVVIEFVLSDFRLFIFDYNLRFLDLERIGGCSWKLDD